MSFQVLWYKFIVSWSIEVKCILLVINYPQYIIDFVQLSFQKALSLIIIYMNHNKTHCLSLGCFLLNHFLNDVSLDKHFEAKEKGKKPSSQIWPQGIVGFALIIIPASGFVSIIMLATGFIHWVDWFRIIPLVLYSISKAMLHSKRKKIDNSIRIFH